MKRVLLSLLGVLLSLPAFSRSIEYEYAGQTLRYTILSEAAMTCEVSPKLGYDIYGDVIIPSQVAEIGYDDDYVAYIKAIYTVTGIGKNAFYGRSLTSIAIPNSVTSIGSEAFGVCRSLTSIDIPNSVTSIEDEAFFGCNGLTSIEIPNSVTSIGNSAFSGCSGLTSIEIPQSVISIGFDAFYECSSLTSAIIRCPVIPRLSFSLIPSLTSVVIENSVKEIGDFAFDGCTNLTSLVIGNSVTKIGKGAFSGGQFTSLELPNSLISIGDWAFDRCSSLTSIEIPNSVTSIGYSAFSDCKTLESINVDDDNEFYASVDGVLYDKDLTRIVQYPAGKKNSKFSIPKTVTEIDGSAFCRCQDLIFIEIPFSVIYIGDYAFYYCINLTSIEIPNSVTKIGDCTFWGCSSLTSIEIPNSVTSIGGGAFQECSSLTSIKIPNTVTSIGYMAFYNASAIESIKVANPNPPVIDGDRKCFSEEVYENATLFVPEGSKDAYESHEVWGLFKNIETFDPNAGIDAVDAAAAGVEVYNLSGAKVGTSLGGLPKGVYIIRQGQKTTKRTI